MNTENFIIGVMVSEASTTTIAKISEQFNIPLTLLIEMAEYGLFPESSGSGEQTIISDKDLNRINSAFRLHNDLGVNLAGVALALDLLTKIETMQEELNILRRHF